MARKVKKKLEQPAWHPNFRNAETLPDIKPIRTDFLLNFVSLALLAGVVTWLAVTEYQAMQLNRTINQLEKSIRSGTQENNTNLRESAEFDRLAALLKEAADFTAMQVQPSELLAAVVDSLPPEMLLTSISLADRSIQQGRQTRYAKSLQLNGTISSLDAIRSTQLVDDYVAVLAKLPGLDQHVEKTTIQSLQRDDRLGLFTFNILVELKPR